MYHNKTDTFQGPTQETAVSRKRKGYWTSDQLLKFTHVLAPLTLSRESISFLIFLKEAGGHCPDPQKHLEIHKNFQWVEMPITEHRWGDYMKRSCENTKLNWSGDGEKFSLGQPT